MRSKLNPQGTSKINFPGFQEILDFTATGSESSVALTVDGDVDKEYRITIRNTSTTDSVCLRINNDSTANRHGRRYLQNYLGTITSNQNTGTFWYLGFVGGSGITEVLTPTGLIKTCFTQSNNYASGTTIENCYIAGNSFNSTANVTLLYFLMSSGAFPTGTRITIYARRSN